MTEEEIYKKAYTKVENIKNEYREKVRAAIRVIEDLYLDQTISYEAYSDIFDAVDDIIVEG